MGGTSTVALIGAECTGKSTLAWALSETLRGFVVSEALREFVDWHRRPPRQDEQLGIFRRQLGRERRARQLGVSWAIYDPAAAMTAVYSQAYFGDSSLLAMARAHLEDADRVLWCRPDLPWVPDAGQRDGPRMRQVVDDLLAEFITALPAAPYEIRGVTPQERLDAALLALG